MRNEYQADEGYIEAQQRLLSKMAREFVSCLEEPMLARMWYPEGDQYEAVNLLGIGITPLQSWIVWGVGIGQER